MTGSAISREVAVSAITPGTAAEVASFIAREWAALENERLRLVPRSTPEVASGWFARDDTGTIVGALVQAPGDSADVGLGNWVGQPGTTAPLYRVAASAWAAQGHWTHRVTVPARDLIGAELLDLGFGHQQAYGLATVDSIRPAPGRGEVRRLSAADSAELASILPLVSRHQSEAPVFAPRVDAFYEQLPSSIAEFLADPATVALGHSEEAGGGLDAFLLAEFHPDVAEVPLMGTVAAQRHTGAGSALLASAAVIAGEHGCRWLLADWRTTNPESARFWRSRGFTPLAYRWCRVVDPTPT